jgi:hypothetical protein
MKNLAQILQRTAPADPFLDQIRRSPGTPKILEHLRRVVPDLKTIPQTTYSLYREFEHAGEREGYQQPYYIKRSQLSRAVLEMIMGDASMRDVVSNLLWSVCEETTWVLPAHEEQGPDFWELRPSLRKHPWGAHTALNREPDSIDLFAAETGASLAETVYLLGDRLPAEVCQRVRQEVRRHIFLPYLAYGRKHWWHQGALNWNGVCNGSIGLAFIRLERDPQTLADALSQVLEGFEAFVATAFEADGGSIEGPGYWNYGLMYYATLAELLRERTGGEIDLLAARRMVDIARYPLGMALSEGLFIDFGDAVERTAFEPGIIQRIAEHTGVSELRNLILPADRLEGFGVATAKLSIMLRDCAWWDGETLPFPPSACTDFYLPACGVAKFAGRTDQRKPVVLAAKAGHNDGHHSHTDIATFIYHVDGESLLCDPGRGRYSKDYFRQSRYENIFCNSIGHNVPRIGGQLQAPGPEFGGSQQYHGEIIEHDASGSEKILVIDYHQAYNLPSLRKARRKLRFSAVNGVVMLEDTFEFEGTPLPVEEAFVTWETVALKGSMAHITGKHSALEMAIEEPAGAVFQVERLEAECRENKREGVLSRITVQLPDGKKKFRMRIMPG